VIGVELVQHHHLQLVVHLLELLHLVLPLDQSHELDHHHELDFNLEVVESLVVQLLWMMMDHCFFVQPKFELELHDASLHPSPSSSLIDLELSPHLQGFYQLALLESRWIHQKLYLS
jgi:hypothetical protein